MDSGIPDEKGAAEMTGKDPEVEQRALPEGTSSLTFSLRYAWENVSIEPVMFLHMLGVSMTGVIGQNLFLERVCRVTLSNTAEACANLIANTAESNKTLEIEVAAEASKYGIYKAFVEFLVPTIFAIFLGPWSDKHGSKVPLLLPLVGFTLSSILNALICLLPDLSVEYLLLSSVPIAITGGMVALVLSASSFIAILTNNDSRSFRFAVLEACWFSGSPIGLLSGAAIYKSAGFLPIFMIATGLYITALVLGILWIREDKPKIDGPSHCLTDFFNFGAVKQTVSIVFERRECHRRKYLLLLIFTMTLKVMALVGPIVCNFLFTRHQFGWNEQSYSTFVATEGFLGVIGVVLMSFLGIQMLKLTDSVVALSSTLGCLAANFIIAFAPERATAGWLMYLAAVAQMFGGMTGISARSIMSKLVTKEEMGRVFSIVACVDTAIVPLAAGMLFSFIYMATQQVFPAAYSLVSAGLNIIIFVNFTYLFFNLRNVPDLK